MLFEKIRKPV